MKRQRILTQQRGAKYALAASSCGSVYERSTNKYNTPVKRRMSEKEIVRELCRGWLWN